MWCPLKMYLIFEPDVVHLPVSQRVEVSHQHLNSPRALHQGQTRWLYSMSQGHINQLCHPIFNFNDVCTFHYYIILKWHVILSKVQF